MLRRGFLTGLGAGWALAALPAGAKDLPWQPPAASHEAFMARAIELSRIGAANGDGTPYGAVVVQRGVIVGEGWNRTAAKTDPTAHAEIEAIQAATRHLARRGLAGCVLYTNGGRPCPMCEGAAYYASLDRVYHAHTADAITDAGPPQISYCR
ncbi:MAG: nucleoside deaminase [Rhodospirillaceae bacterium]